MTEKQDALSSHKADQATAPGAWIWLLYICLFACFGLIALFKVSHGRDPFLGTWRVPDGAPFRVACAIIAAACGIGSLSFCGLIIDRGSTNQMLALLPVLPLILIILDAISLL